MAETPPAVDRAPELAARLKAAWAAKGPQYQPRTHLLDAEGHARFVNRLIFEASPYLLQHAHNPVDWRAWSDETLAEAAAFGRPIFLSVGYATCHWCHVMEEESFDNVEVAEVLNRLYIPVKLDREQRPDLDQIYITATQLQQGHAGWPNSVFIMPDGRPFHTGTYFPRPQFIRVLEGVAEAWRAKRGEVERVAAALSVAINRQGPSGAPPAALDQGVHATVSGQLARMFNEAEGGFSTTQQFPQEGFLLYLLDHWRRTGDTAAWAMAERSLDAIAAGGIHDHAGGGFHRYTVDPNWRTPHFEKMLYNQGQLARAFVEGWEITNRSAWRRAAERTFDYVLRDMTDPEGAFHAAEDADSPDTGGRREEGAFYAWTPAEARAVLGEDADWAISALGIDREPTIEAGAVVHLDPRAEADFARLEPALERLRMARDARARPFRDAKIIAGWNGLMIRVLAEGAAAFGRPDLAEAGARAGEALWERLWDGTRLARLWSGDRAIEEGMLEDYAWLGLGFLSLADTGAGDVWRERAIMLADAAEARFADPSGRLRMAAKEGPFGPIFDSSDGATPSGESSMAEFFVRLALRDPAPALRARARRLIGALARPLSEMPLLRPDALVAARTLEEGESGARRVLADGVLRASIVDSGRRIVLDVARGWHVNASEPGAEGLVGASLEGAEAHWPAAREIEAGFADRPIRVLEGRVEIPLVPSDPVITLRIQPCSDRICLEPVETRFRLR